MKLPKRISVLLVGLAAVALPQAEACGDKLVALGGGVPFQRIHAQRLTGQIVMLIRSESGLSAFNQQAGLSRALLRAGHTVRVVDNQRDLDGALNASRADVVLADEGDANDLRNRLAGDAAAPLVLAVVPMNAGAAIPAQALCSVQASLKQSRSLVKTIEGYMTRRQAGTAIHCATDPERRT